MDMQPMLLRDLWEAWLDIWCARFRLELRDVELVVARWEQELAR